MANQFGNGLIIGQKSKVKAQKSKIKIKSQE